jgi:hypothetical protein
VLKTADSSAYTTPEQVDKLTEHVAIAAGFLCCLMAQGIIVRFLGT